MHDLELDLATAINTLLAGAVAALLTLVPVFVMWMKDQAKLLAIKWQSEINARKVEEVKTDLKQNTEMTKDKNSSIIEMAAKVETMGQIIDTHLKG